MPRFCYQLGPGQCLEHSQIQLPGSLPSHYDDPAGDLELEPGHPASTWMLQSESFQSRTTLACSAGMHWIGSSPCSHPPRDDESNTQLQHQILAGEQPGCREPGNQRSCEPLRPEPEPYRAASRHPCRFQYRDAETASTQKRGQKDYVRQHRFEHSECDLG